MLVQARVMIVSDGGASWLWWHGASGSGVAQSMWWYALGGGWRLVLVEEKVEKQNKKG